MALPTAVPTARPKAMLTVVHSRACVHAYPRANTCADSRASGHDDSDADSCTIARPTAMLNAMPTVMPQQSHQLCKRCASIGADRRANTCADNWASQKINSPWADNHVNSRVDYRTDNCTKAAMANWTNDKVHQLIIEGWQHQRPTEVAEQISAMVDWRARQQIHHTWQEKITK